MSSTPQDSTSPRLTIVTVALNNRDGLERTLASVHDRQPFRDFEQVVVDGASTDGTVELLRAYEPRLAHWVSEPDRGIYHAMNKGAARARGDFLLFLNSGDTLAPDALSAFFAAMPDADIVYGNLQFHVRGVPEQLWVPPDASRLDLAFWASGSLPHGASFIRRALFEKGGYDESYRIVGDREFFFRQYRGGARFAHVDRLVSWFARGGVSNDPLHVETRRNEVLRIFTPCLAPDLQSLLTAEHQRRMAFDAQLFRQRANRVHASRNLRDHLRVWLDIFFRLERSRMAAAVLRACIRAVRHREARRQR
ncbi:MAG: glycosyltransferase family 2 protein [Kiritimatiellae bacterium]|nr:glycosyltransferase family 2 protein [Kiritimatiellia bacterium]